jgi:hypothetical protein
VSEKQQLRPQKPILACTQQLADALPKSTPPHHQQQILGAIHQVGLPATCATCNGGILLGCWCCQYVWLLLSICAALTRCFSLHGLTILLSPRSNESQCLMLPYILFCCCSRGQDPIISAVEARIAEWTRLPADHGEPIQVRHTANIRSSSPSSYHPCMP